MFAEVDQLLKQTGSTLSKPTLQDNPILKVENPPTSEPDDKECVKTILQKMYKLQNDVENIKKILLQMQKSTTNSPALEIAEEFIRIYAGEKKRASVSVNEEIKDRVRKYISEAYGISGNDSLAINTALLVALYKGRGK